MIELQHTNQRAPGRGLEGQEQKVQVGERTTGAEWRQVGSFLSVELAVQEEVRLILTYTHIL